VNQNASQSDEDKIKGGLLTLRVILIVMLLSQLVVFAVFMRLRSNEQFSTDTEVAGILQHVALAAVLAALGATLLARKFTAHLLGSAESLAQAVQRYLPAVIVPAAVCEGAGFFCLVVLLLGADQRLMVLLWVLTAVLLLTHLPSRTRLSENYNQARESHLISSQRS